MLNGPFNPWPSFSDEEVAAVSAVLRSNRVNYWTGNVGKAFEQAFADWTETRHAIAVANGTLALELALRGLDIGPGDEVIVSPRSYIASASSIVTVGAIPVFVDVDRDSQNISAETIAPAITDRTRAIVCVHLAGWPCDMDPILALARTHNLKVIEDCAQAHGARYRGRPVGSLGDVGAWSFCQDKIMTTGGEGGMVTTQQTDLWEKMWAYKDHGKSYEAVHAPAQQPGFRWVHESFGSNWRLTEMQAAIGQIQLAHMHAWQQRRVENCREIWAAAQQLSGLRAPQPGQESMHAGYRCYVFVEKPALKTGWDRDRIMQEIIAAGVPCFQGSCGEIYREKAFVNAGLAPTERLPVAMELGETSLAFLVHPTLSDEQIAKTVETLHQVMHQATR